MNGIKLNNYIKKEDKKYSQLYKKGYGQGPIDIIIKILKDKNITLDNTEVLDCGCGHSPILNIFKFKRYVGIDISSFQIAKLKEKRPYLEYYQGSIDDLSKFKDKEFEFVWCSDVLEHISEDRIEKVLNEINRVSKKAIISVSVREALILSEDKEQLHQTIKPIKWWDEKFNEIFNHTSLIELFRNNKKINAFLYITENV